MAATSNLAWLYGLDIGSTTANALVAQATLLRNSVTRRMELGHPKIVYRSPVTFTPYVGDELDAPAIAGLVETWIDDARIAVGELFAGGVIVTGLAARAANAAKVAELIRGRFQQALVVTADDPRLESWLAFLGNCQAVSRLHSGTPVVNMDIGGGTTNPAWGLAGEVRHVGCYAIGARHVRLAPGTWRITGLSPLAVRLFNHLGIRKQVGDELGPSQVAAIVDLYVEALEAIVAGNRRCFDREPMRWFEQVAFEPPRQLPSILTLSGGVGDLAYRCARGEPLPSLTAYGDLGIELARGICRSDLLAKDLLVHTPSSLGGATVMGLALHTAEISGTTLFLPDSSILPLSGLPIVGCLSGELDCSRLAELVELAKASRKGAALQIDLPLDGWQSVKRLAETVATVLVRADYPSQQPLVMLLPQNLGKTLGQYVTAWNSVRRNLIVIDELPPRRARFLSLGRLQRNVVPVSYYGLCEAGQFSEPCSTSHYQIHDNFGT